MKSDIVVTVSSDLQTLAADTARNLPTVADTSRALEAALAHRKRPAARRLLRTRVLMGGVAVGIAVLLVPVPYRRQVGWETTVRDGRAHLSPRTELVWGSVYAMAREKLLHLDVALSGKTGAEAEAELGTQLAEQGWTADDVAVERRDDGTTTVRVGATNAEGRHLQVMQHRADGVPMDRVQFEQEPIDDAREPGMTDEQLRDKIVAQFRARGLDADVTVEGGRVQVRAMKRPPPR